MVMCPVASVCLFVVGYCRKPRYTMLPIEIFRWHTDTVSLCPIVPIDGAWCHRLAGKLFQILVPATAIDDTNTQSTARHGGASPRPRKHLFIYHHRP